MMYCFHCMAKLPDDAQVCEFCHHDPKGKASSHHLALGTLLNNRYLIGESIGEGGFGISYIGLDTNLNLKIAVKEFYPYGYANRNNQISNDVSLIYSKETDYYVDAKNRFLREAQGIAKFSKERAIVDVRDYFTENNTAYIVMEYVEGVTLSVYLRDHGVFEEHDLVSRMMPLMDALQKMHREEVIHRDISPENIMITDDGSLKLMDFGSARYFAGDNKRTMSVILKPGYAPFEQYSADGNQGPWTDVYALCATMYKCLTEITPPDAMKRCQEDTLKMPSQLGVHISRELEAALARGLCIYPQDRLSSIEDFLAILFSAGNAGKGVKPITKKYGSGADVNRTYGDTYSRYVNEQEQNRGKKLHPAIPILIAIFVFVLVIAGVVLYVVLNSADDKKTDDPIEAARVSVSESPTVPVTVPMTETVNPNAVVVPDVVGKKLSDAKTELKNLDLSVEVTREPSDTVAKGYVIRQSVDAKRTLNKGDTIMLYVSSGIDKSVTEIPSSPAVQTAPTEPLDVQSAVNEIRLKYYSVKSNPGVMSQKNGVTYYSTNNTVNVAICQSGHDKWDMTREYYYDNGELYFAFVYSGSEEYRLYYFNGTLIRYIDNTGRVTDYGNINCPIESRVLAEANKLN